MLRRGFNIISTIMLPDMNRLNRLCLFFTDNPTSSARQRLVVMLHEGIPISPIRVIIELNDNPTIRPTKMSGEYLSGSPQAVLCNYPRRVEEGIRTLILPLCRRYSNRSSTSTCHRDLSLSLYPSFDWGTGSTVSRHCGFC